MRTFLTNLSICFILLFRLSAISQTTEETENWITNKININDKNNYGSQELKGEEYVYFKDGFLFNRTTTGFDKKNIYISWSKVRIKDIKKISFGENTSLEGNNKWIELSLFADKGKIYGCNDPKSAKSVPNYEFSINPEQFLIQVRLEPDFISSGLASRMEKALLHLVQKYGGKLEIEKEPF